MNPALEPSVALGIALGDPHVLGIDVGYLRSKTTEEWPDDPDVFPGPAPYTVSLRAIPIEVTYRYHLPMLRVGGLQPVVGVGPNWMLVTDTWESDTPAESRRTSVFGGTALVEIQLPVVGRLSAVVHGQYRWTVEPEERYPRAVGLDGFSAQGGLQVSF